MKIPPFSALALATVTLLSVSQPASASLLNGSFENGFLGWSVSGNASVVASAPYVPSDGTKLVAFNSFDSAPNGIVSQTVSGQAGRFHKLTFDVGNLSQNTQSQRIRVKITGEGGTTTLIDEITIPGTGGGSTNWISKEYEIFQPSATQTLSFEDISASTVSQDLILDNVRLVSLLELNVSTSADMAGPPPGPVIDLYPASHEGLQGGNSPLAPRNYWEGSQVMLVAPEQANGWFFQKWEKTTTAEDNSQATVDINGRLVFLTLDQKTAMKAVYLPGLTFAEEEGLSIKGPAGTGPFTPSGKVFTIRNNTSGSLPWNAETITGAQPAWFSVFPISGTLAPGATVSVQLSVNPVAQDLTPEGDGLDPGKATYHGQLRAVSPSLSSVDSREIVIQVVPVLTVTTLEDENDGWNVGGFGNSLREVLDHANTLNRESITLFDPALAGGAIILAGGELEVTCDNTIDASNLSGGIMISANYASRILKIHNTPFSTGATSVKIDNITFLNGYAMGETDNDGGAIHCMGNLDLDYCTFAGNWADGDGGAIGGSLAAGSLDHCLFEGNLATGDGGAIGTTVSRLTLANSTIAGNTGAHGGGIANTGELTITDSTISGNEASADGGGIHATVATASHHYDFGSLSLVNSTIANNEAQLSGGGIYADTYGNSLIHCTVSGNAAGYIAGGLNSNTRKFTFGNTIIAGNTAYLDSNLGGVPALPHEFAGYNLLDGDPKLAPLANYGGITATMPPLPGSPAVDTTLVLPSAPTLDQRGATRPYGPLPDLGATEAFPFSTLPLVDSDEDGIDDRLEPAYGLVVGIDDRGRDSDGDGSNDAQEIANMTDPRDSSSRLKILSFAPVFGSTPAAPFYQVTFTSFPGLSYSLQTDPELSFGGSGTTFHTYGIADGNISTAIIPMAPGRDFVRVVRE